MTSIHITDAQAEILDGADQSKSDPIARQLRTECQAQANATVVLLGVSMLPLVTLFNPGGEAAWHLWVPALGQITLMGRVLKGEPLAALDRGIPLLVSVAVAVEPTAAVGSSATTRWFWE